MKKAVRYVGAMLVSMPSIGWCLMTVRYAMDDMIPMWLATLIFVLQAVIGFYIWQRALEPSVYESVVKMPLYDLLLMLNERKDIRRVIINELEGTDYVEEKEADV